ncbi:hypothetical protein GYB61_05650 [bacterium]|nr:hypothetical protein [bacterium]
MADSVRLDKWLWAVRLFKTRKLAQEAISRGRVKVDGSPAKASRSLRVGQTVALEKLAVRDEVMVAGLSEKRVSASEAAELYRRTDRGAAMQAEDIEKRRLQRLMNQPVAPDGRPGKHARDVLRKAKRRQS